MSLFDGRSYFDRAIAAGWPVHKSAEETPFDPVDRPQLRSWVDRIDDILDDCATGDVSDYERAVQSLDQLRNEIEGLLRSSNDA